MKIRLNKTQSKLSNNVDNYISIEMQNNSISMPVDDIYETVDRYEQYVKENDESNKYRLIFTINPICSNVLFNPISEIVYKEGSDDCVFFGENGPSNTNFLHNAESVSKYVKYKGYSESDPFSFKRYNLIQDTAFSSSEIGPFVYHCGYDIFNNHILRKKEFNIIDKISDDVTDANFRKNFNTLNDYLRDVEGASVMEYKRDLPNVTSVVTSPAHLYQYDTVHSFKESINENLVEEDGWFGFINPSGMDIKNYVTDEYNIAINKCMNNNKVCEQIDMYPDRSLYSFIPKVNKYRNRIENNWDYCLTYPYGNYTNNSIVKFNFNGTVKTGLEIFIASEEIKINSDQTYVLFNSRVKNNLSENDLIKLYISGTDLSGNTQRIETYTDIKVAGLGDEGVDIEHYFYVNIEDFYSYYSIFQEISNIRMVKMYMGIPCQYYFRIFRRLPNFANTNVYADGEVSESEIAEHMMDDFSSSLSKLAYGENIYSDKIAQIIFNDDIVTTGLKDNLGRDLSEIYLTIVKTNKGHEEWYENNDYGNENVEYSHCFGKISSGLDLDADSFNYNVHKIHDVEVNQEIKENLFINDSPKKIEEDITINGSNNDGEFIGDLVEFTPYTITEVILEDIYHRFNTVQREIVSDEFRNIYYDNITYDDSDIDGSGLTTECAILNGEIGGESYPANIFPEGYYYKPHYRIQLKEFSNTVQQGSHTRIVYTAYTLNNRTLNMQTSTNYYLEVGDNVYMYKKSGDTKYTATVTKVEGSNFTNVTIELPFNISSVDDYLFFKPNILMPSSAYEIADGSGRYLYKEFLTLSEMDTNSELYNRVFSNGAHYIHENLIFYLRRQDPNGEYDLSYENKNVDTTIKELVIGGKSLDITDSEIMEENAGTIC